MIAAWVGVALLLLGFALGAVFGACIAVLCRRRYRPMSAAARALLAKRGRGWA